MIVSCKSYGTYCLQLRVDGDQVESRDLKGKGKAIMLPGQLEQF